MTDRVFRWFAAVIVLVVAADWLTKAWVLNRMALGDTLAVVDGWLYFAHRQNPGIAFSLFADLPEVWRTPLLTGLSLVGIFVIVHILRSTTDMTMRWAAVLLLGGAVANLGDRIVSGSVTDFIHLPMFPYVFNLADTAITVGGTLLVIRMVFGQAAPEPVPEISSNELA